MANVRIARVALKRVNSLTGAILDGSNTGSSGTISDNLNIDQQHRVIEDSGNPSTTGSPTVDDYLQVEAAANYVVQYMDQYTIITYERTAAGGFA